VAEIAVAEYTEAIHKRDLEDVESEIAQAKLDLKRAGELSASHSQAVQQASLRLGRVQTKKTELLHDIKDQTVKQLKNEVNAAKANELAKTAAYEQLKSAVANLWW